MNKKPLGFGDQPDLVNAITRQILEAHGTAPHVESTKGRGSRFWFDLPLADAANGNGHDVETATTPAMVG